jgi:hypothetical protein
MKTLQDHPQTQSRARALSVPSQNKASLKSLPSDWARGPTQLHPDFNKAYATPNHVLLKAPRHLPAHANECVLLCMNAFKHQQATTCVPHSLLGVKRKDDQPTTAQAPTKKRAKSKGTHVLMPSPVKREAGTWPPVSIQKVALSPGASQG